MKKYIPSIVPIILTFFSVWIGFHNWWFVPIYIILGSSGIGILFLKKDPLTTPMYLRMECTNPTLIVSLVCFIGLTIFLFIVATPWWLVLIVFVLVVVSYKLFFSISSIIILLIPTLLSM